SNVVFRPDGLGPSGLQMAEGSMGARRVLDELASLWRAAGNSIAPFRWLADRTLVRVRGSGRQHYRLKVWTDVARLSSVPSLRLVIDGVEHGRGHADDA